MLSWFCGLQVPEETVKYDITERKVLFSSILKKYKLESKTLNMCIGKTLQISDEFAYIEKIKVLGPCCSLTLKIDGIVIKQVKGDNTMYVYFPTPYFFGNSIFQLEIESINMTELYNCEITGCNMNESFNIYDYITTTVYFDQHPDYVKMDYVKYVAYQLKFHKNKWHTMKVEYYKKTYPQYTIEKLKYGDHYMVHTNNIDNPLSEYVIEEGNHKSIGLLLLIFFEDKQKEFGINTLNKLNFSVFTLEQISMDYIIETEQDIVNIHYKLPYTCDFIKSIYFDNPDFLEYSFYFQDVEYGKEVVFKKPYTLLGNVKPTHFYITTKKDNLHFFKNITLKIEKGYFATPLRNKLYIKSF